MAANIVTICNRALLSIGTRTQIASLTEGSTEANACTVFFTPTFESLARSAPWNCLRKQAMLTLLKAATGTPENPTGTSLPQPPTPWLYSYALPSDCLDMRFIVPSLPSNGVSTPLTTASVSATPWIPSDGQIVYAVAYDTDDQNNPIQVILCNLSQAQAVYTVNQPNPAIWDSLFQQAMVSSLAAYLVPALSLNLLLMQGQIKVAENAIVQARVRDGDEGVTVMDHVPDWIRARGYDGYNGTGGYIPVTYLNMCWPGEV